MRPRRSIASGAPLVCSRIGRRRSKLSTDPLFVEKVRDIVGLYLVPPDRAVVLCVDEKTQVQALDRTQPLLPMRPGQVERHTHDYTPLRQPHTLFAALDVKLGTIVGRCFPRHRAVEFRRFLDEVEQSVPSDLDVHVIMDNAGTHKTKLIRHWLPDGRAGISITRRPPPRGSNQVERWFRLASTARALRRGVHRSTAELEAPSITTSP